MPFPKIRLGLHQDARGRLERGAATLLFPKYKSLFYLLTRLERACCGARHLCTIGGHHPTVFLRDLIVSLVDRIDRPRVDQLQAHGIVARVLQIVFLAVKAAAVAELARVQVFGRRRFPPPELWRVQLPQKQGLRRH